MRLVHRHQCLQQARADLSVRHRSQAEGPPTDGRRRSWARRACADRWPIRPSTRTRRVLVRVCHRRCWRRSAASVIRSALAPQCRHRLRLRAAFRPAPCVRARCLRARRATRCLPEEYVRVTPNFLRRPRGIRATVRPAQAGRRKWDRKRWGPVQSRHGPEPNPEPQRRIPQGSPTPPSSSRRRLPERFSQATAARSQQVTQERQTLVEKRKKRWQKHRDERIRPRSPPGLRPSRTTSSRCAPATSRPPRSTRS